MFRLNGHSVLAGEKATTKDWTMPDTGKVKAILAAARDLFGRKGYEKTTVARIAARAEVASGTVIYHFKSKDNLLFILTRQILVELFNRTRAGISAAPTPRQALEAYVGVYFDFIREKPEDFLVLTQLDWLSILNTDRHPTADLKLVYTRYIHLIEEILAQGVDDQSFKPVPSRETGLILFSMLSCAGRIHVEQPGEAENIMGEILRFMRSRLLRD